MNQIVTIILWVLLVLCILLLIKLTIYRQIEEHYTQDDPVLNRLRETFREFFDQERYWEAPLEMLNEGNPMDKIKLYRGEKSYTINKEKVYLCLKDENDEYYPENPVLLHVLAHEIGHVLTRSIGHTPEFHEKFEALLLELSKAGIYDPSIPIPHDYCTTSDSEIA